MLNAPLSRKPFKPPELDIHLEGLRVSLASPVQVFWPAHMHMCGHVPSPSTSSCCRSLRPRRQVSVPQEMRFVGARIDCMYAGRKGLDKLINFFCLEASAAQSGPKL